MGCVKLGRDYAPIEGESCPMTGPSELGADGPWPTEVVVTGSSFSGGPPRVNTNDVFFGEALRPLPPPRVARQSDGGDAQQGEGGRLGQGGRLHCLGSGMERNFERVRIPVGNRERARAKHGRHLGHIAWFRIKFVVTGKRPLRVRGLCGRQQSYSRRP